MARQAFALIAMIIRFIVFLALIDIHPGNILLYIYLKTPIFTMLIALLIGYLIFSTKVTLETRCGKPTLFVDGITSKICFNWPFWV